MVTFVLNDRSEKAGKSSFGHATSSAIFSASAHWCWLQLPASLARPGPQLTNKARTVCNFQKEGYHCGCIKVKSKERKRLYLNKADLTHFISGKTLSDQNWDQEPQTKALVVWYRSSVRPFVVMDLLFAAEQYAAAQVRLSLFICSKIWSTSSYSGNCSSCSSILCECSKCSNECSHWWSKPKDGPRAWPGNNTSSTSWYHKTPGTKMSPDDAARHDDGSDGPSTKVTIMFKVWKHWKQISCQKWHSSALDPKCLSN